MSYEEMKQEQAQRNIQAASATRARQQDRPAKQGGTAAKRLPQQYTNQELFQQVLSSSALRNNRGQDSQQHDVSDLRGSSQTQEYSLFSTDSIEQTLLNPIQGGGQQQGGDTSVEPSRFVGDDPQRYVTPIQQPPQSRTTEQIVERILKSPISESEVQGFPVPADQIDLALREKVPRAGTTK